MKKILLVSALLFSINSYATTFSMTLNSKDIFNSAVDSIKNKYFSDPVKNSNTIKPINNTNVNVDNVIRRTGGYITYESMPKRVGRYYDNYKEVNTVRKVITGKETFLKGMGGIALEEGARYAIDNHALKREKYDEYKDEQNYLDLVNKIKQQADELDKEYKKSRDLCKNPVYAKERIKEILRLTPVKYSNTTNTFLVSTRNMDIHRNSNKFFFYVDSYNINLNRNRTNFNDEQVDHIPAYKSVEKALISKGYNIKDLNDQDDVVVANNRDDNSNLDNNLSSIITPTLAHKSGRTYGKIFLNDYLDLRSSTILDLAAIMYVIKYNKDMANLYSRADLNNMLHDYQQSALILYTRNSQMCLYNIPTKK